METTTSNQQLWGIKEVSQVTVSNADRSDRSCFSDGRPEKDWVLGLRVVMGTLLTWHLPNCRFKLPVVSAVIVYFFC